MDVMSDMKDKLLHVLLLHVSTRVACLDEEGVCYSVRGESNLHHLAVQAECGLQRESMTEHHTLACR